MADKTKAIIGAAVGLGIAAIALVRSRKAKASPARESVAVPLNTKVGRWFKLSEFLKSTRFPALASYQMSADEALNLTALVTLILDPLRDKFGALKITSGGRPESVALATGTTWFDALSKAGFYASKTSDHTDFSAADIYPSKVPSDRWLEVIAAIVGNLNTRQVYASFKRDKKTGKLIGQFIHVAVVRPGKPRKAQVFFGLIDGKVVQEIKE